RTDQNGGFTDRLAVLMGQSIDAIDQTRVCLAADNSLQYLVRSVQLQIIDLKFEGLGELEQSIVADIKDAVLHDRYGFAVQVDDGLNGGGGGGGDKNLP